MARSRKAIGHRVNNAEARRNDFPCGQFSYIAYELEEQRLKRKAARAARKVITLPRLKFLERSTTEGE